MIALSLITVVNFHIILSYTAFSSSHLGGASNNQCCYNFVNNQSIRSHNQKIEELHSGHQSLSRMPFGVTLPPKPSGGRLLEPVIVFTRMTTEKECFSVINNNRIQVILNESICGSSVDIMAVILGVLGIVVPKNSNLRLWDLMPWNLRDFDDMRQNCNMENALQADPPEVDWIPLSTIQDLNQIYCADSCPSRPQCHNNGVVNSKRCSQCICSEGFSGLLCDKLTQSNGRSSAWCKATKQMVTDERQAILFGTADLSRQPYSPPQDCTWLFTAPPGRQIRFQLTGDAFGYNCTQECICRDYLEIRDTEDMSIKGYRFCCSFLRKRTVISKANRMLIVSHIHNLGSRGFQGLIFLAAQNAEPGYS